MQTDATSWELHNLIASDRVEGTPVRSAEGIMIGTIERVIIDKASGNVSYAVLSFNGSVHVGCKNLAIPWHGLTYDRTTASYNRTRPHRALAGVRHRPGQPRRENRTLR
jgi:PRC-barrel domain